MADIQEHDSTDDEVPAPIVWHGMEALLNDGQIARYLIDGTNRGMNRTGHPEEEYDPEWWQYHNRMLCELLHQLIVEIVKPNRD